MIALQSICCFWKNERMINDNQNNPFLSKIQFNHIVKFANEKENHNFLQHKLNHQFDKLIFQKSKKNIVQIENDFKSTFQINQFTSFVRLV